MLDQQWIISIAVGAVGGFFDGLYSQGGVSWISPWRNETGRTIYDLGTIGHVLTGAAAGFISYGLNFAGAGFSAPPQLGPSVASFVAGVGGSEFLRRMRDDRQLREAAQSLGQGTDQAMAAVQELSGAEGPQEEQA
jgi:hypothetical protein